MENKYLKRLLDEWNQYGKIVIAVDCLMILKQI
jgi:hypothetical protein